MECARTDATATALPAETQTVSVASTAAQVRVNLHLAPTTLFDDKGIAYNDPDEGEPIIIGADTIGSKRHLAIERDLCWYSETLEDMLQDLPDEMLEQSVIPLDNITKPIAEKIFAYYRHRHSLKTPQQIAAERAARVESRRKAGTQKSELDDQDCPVTLDAYAIEFFKGIDVDTLCDIMEATNFLAAFQLLDEACQWLANNIEKKKP